MASTACIPISISTLRTPALRQTIALGIPTLLATVCMFVSTSITNAAALVVQPETGPSVIAYARLWYTLPYALIAASLSTALYTELSHDAQEKDYDSVRTAFRVASPRCCSS